MFHDHINPMQWHQAQGVARQSCARFFRDGGTPADAVRAFGIASVEDGLDWVKAVEQIAGVLCAQPQQQRLAA